MITIAKLLHVNAEEIPKSFANKTYIVFSFEVYNDIPMGLYMVDSEENELMLVDLDKLTSEGRQQVAEFLKTIKIDNSRFGNCIKWDIAMAKHEFGVDIEVLKGDEN